MIQWLPSDSSTHWLGNDLDFDSATWKR